MNSAFIKVARVSVGLMVALLTPSAWALSVSPSRTEINLLPGQITATVITVTNPHAEPYNVELSEKPWFVYPDNKTINVSDWLKLPSKRHFKLKPGKSREIQLTISCPKEAVGELMGMVSFAYQSMQASMITPMISTPVYLQVSGTQKNIGEITAVGAGTRNGFFSVGVQVKATGNVRLRPTGTLRLFKDKTHLAEYMIPEGNPIFPGMMRDCPANGPNIPPEPGRYLLTAEVHSGSLELKSEQYLTVKANGDVEMDKAVHKEATPS